MTDLLKGAAVWLALILCTWGAVLLLVLLIAHYPIIGSAACVAVLLLLISVARPS